ncbi:MULTISPECIES: tyrosine-type recombinase/integrase [unclassified Acinetobacter]|uniref:site-specific integrase n=1 Tax=unclassified Acinetobacter TaxID=196816 RepID=UPI002449543B|nr:MULTISPECIES: tyrosine-type recombinase/integrase [unclassified Acinetobacter]MDH0031373.1 tyrosine-type recombinase/integrase [Acinetobacter sp. GD04021]MDH0887142.1 tyrosine-type recombinase/integrase [Acinetobacter sp. GD03873]MDH1083569.1 tyrosine-type recombinase/integrase [Acinetobacter sp. GD03983]MDH2190458.1 tyrosine-type recombinase/integrase [Acinetobacter sp. GD03645]MDH2204096.1 tyrosine-type recombinase/integrase [Acinetobacter sp. GD03647]
MGSIRQRSLTDGTLRFRAEIRINRKDYPEYNESKTFNSRRIAENWLYKREKELNDNPELLSGKNNTQNLTLGQAIAKYLDEVDGVYSKSKVNTLKLLQRLPISKRPLKQIKPVDISDHVNLRKAGYPKLKLSSVIPSTIQNELVQVRVVLVHASIMWEMDIDINSFDKTTAQLRKTRQISASNKRDRLPDSDELKKLLQFFARKWNEQKHSRYPMHYIILLAIFSCRRESELTRMHLSNFDGYNQTWLVKNLKNPKGSLGNNREFTVLEPCQKVIDLFMEPELRKRMYKTGLDKDLLLPLNPKTIASEFTRACMILGIEDLRFHDFRHEGCTRLAEQGFTIPQIQQVSLHESWNTLQRYVSVKKRRYVPTLEDLLSFIDEA